MGLVEWMVYRKRVHQLCFEPFDVEFHEWHRASFSACFEKNKRVVETDGANAFLKRHHDAS